MMIIYAEHDTYGDVMYGVNFHLYDLKEWLFNITLHPDRVSFLNPMNNDDSQDEMPISDWCDDPVALGKALQKNIDEYEKHENDEDFDCRILENQLLGHIVNDEDLFKKAMNHPYIQKSLIEGIWELELPGKLKLKPSPAVTMFEF